MLLVLFCGLSSVFGDLLCVWRAHNAPRSVHTTPRISRKNPKRLRMYVCARTGCRERKIDIRMGRAKKQLLHDGTWRDGAIVRSWDSFFFFSSIRCSSSRSTYDNFSKRSRLYAIIDTGSQRLEGT